MNAERSLDQIQMGLRPGTLEPHRIPCGGVFCWGKSPPRSGSLPPRAVPRVAVVCIMRQGILRYPLLPCGGLLLPDSVSLQTAFGIGTLLLGGMGWSWWLKRGMG